MQAPVLSNGVTEVAINSNQQLFCRCLFNTNVTDTLCGLDDAICMILFTMKSIHL